MPAKSVAQASAAGMALAAKRGQIKVSKLSRAARQMFDSMSEEELVKFARTGHRGLPEHVKKKG